MNKKLVVRMMEDVYNNKVVTSDDLLELGNDRFALAKIGFCGMLRIVNDYRVSMKKKPLVVRIITTDNTDLDMMIDGNRIKLVGSDNLNYVNAKNAKEFNLVYSLKGSAIMLELGEKIGNKIFLASGVISQLDALWDLSVNRKMTTNTIDDALDRIATKVNNDISEATTDEELEEAGLTREEILSTDDVNETITEEVSDDMNDDKVFEDHVLLTRGAIATILNVVPHKISNAITKGKLQSTPLDTDTPDGRGTRYVSLQQLLEFITSDSVYCDDTYPKRIPISGVKKGLRLDTVAYMGMKLDDDGSITMDDLIKLLGIMITEFDKISEEDANDEFVMEIANAAVEFDGVFDVTDMNVRELVLANLFNNVKITPANLIFDLNRKLFSTKEEIAVLEYMNNNICDIILFMAPELRPILRMLTTSEPDGYLAPVNHVEVIKREYPTVESIADISKEKVEELLFPGILLLKKFRGSLFLFVNSVYPGIDPASLKHLPDNDFTDEQLTALVNRLTPLLPLATSVERASLFRAIGVVITLIEQRVNEG